MNELSKRLCCVQMRSGVEIWVEGERADRLQDVLAAITGSKFIRFEGETFNSADIVGVFKAGTMEEVTRRKNGEWRCQEGAWHERREKCGCSPAKEKAAVESRYEAIKKCGKCENGFIRGNENTVVWCECQGKPLAGGTEA